MDGQEAVPAGDTPTEQVVPQAGTAPAGIGTVVLVGGSSLMGMIGEVVSEVCPGARQARAQAFTAVVDGLALASA